MQNIEYFDTKIETIGEPTISSNLDVNKFITDNNKITMDVTKDFCSKVQDKSTKPLFVEMAGPREKLFFDAKKIKAAIVTCGGLCPGLNDVIRSLVMTLFYTYSCENIVGAQYGYEGLTKKFNHPLIKLNPIITESIHNKGGTMLGTSRGPQDTEEIVDFLVEHEIDILFGIGGDGTLRGVHDIAIEVKKRNLPKSIIGVPKTIDNDINNIAKSFGFETSFSKSDEVLIAAHNEAKSVRNGIAIVKLMGRDSGFIATSATLANRDVNYCLIPEIDFDLEGEKGLLKSLEERFKTRNHALIVVAEGAGQKFFAQDKLKKDKSGNIQKGDIGLYLKEKIANYLKEKQIETSIKYFDPSYYIRSIRANSNDSLFCGFLGQMAVHAAMAGKTDMVVGSWNNFFTHLPINAATGKKKKVTDNHSLWLAIKQTTGQPSLVN